MAAQLLGNDGINDQFWKPFTIDIKKRWQEYTEELYKKVFMTQIIMMV